MEDTYDFIVVGAGPAGCILANRLANAFKNLQILLIEAGGDNKAEEHLGFGDRTFTLATAPGFNWGYKTVPQEHLAHREIDYSRGKGLGGSTAINFCVWTRGPACDYDRWAQIVGDETWSWENVQERYEKIEQIQKPPTEYQNYVDMGDKVTTAKGEVKIGFPKGWDPDFGRYLDSIYSDGYPQTLDLNSGDPIGLGVMQYSMSSSRRVTAASAFLSTLPSNLAVLTTSVVRKVVFEGHRTRGIATDSGI
ncbi:MAG: hypothetical protein Q9174_005736, partial [Haloplaca sp. 1 TL-2023]